MFQIKLLLVQTRVFTYFYKFLRPQSLLEACVSYSRKFSALVNAVEASSRTSFIKPPLIPVPPRSEAQKHGYQVHPCQDPRVESFVCLDCLSDCCVTWLFVFACFFLFFCLLTAIHITVKRDRLIVVCWFRTSARRPTHIRNGFRVCFSRVCANPRRLPTERYASYSHRSVVRVVEFVLLVRVCARSH